MSWHIRPYESGDLVTLARIYRDGIKGIGLDHYSQDQVNAWAGFADDKLDFSGWISGAATFVAVNGVEPVGFAGLEPGGRIASLFVAPANMRRGIGTALLKYLMREILERQFPVVTTDASEFSKPLFEKFGFRVQRVEQARFNGVDFNRYVMTLKVRPDPV